MITKPHNIIGEMEVALTLVFSRHIFRRRFVLASSDIALLYLHFQVSPKFPSLLLYVQQYENVVSTSSSLFKFTTIPLSLVRESSRGKHSPERLK